LCLLKTSISEKCSERLCPGISYKRRSQFFRHFLSANFWCVSRETGLFQPPRLVATVVNGRARASEKSAFREARCNAHKCTVVYNPGEVLSVTTRVLWAFVLLIVSTYSVTQTAGFDGVEKWKGTLTATAIASLKSLYSTDPPARFIGKDQKPTPDIVPETDFW